jgi:molybdopterin/thiamine biosynthesis adenylyltransferase
MDLSLSDEERARYEWQMWLPGMGEEGQCRLKASSVLVSRVGGLGGLVALELAAAGVGRLILAHGGLLKPSDLNRQLLQSRSGIGRPRIEGIVQRLREFNPDCEVVALPHNASAQNAEDMVSLADVVVDAAPLFEERLALNSAAMRLGRPMVECAMHGMEISVTTFLPGRSGCLACYVPEVPASWKRQFPVFGAVSGTAACFGAVEVIKLLTGLGSGLVGEMLHGDLATMRLRRLSLPKRADCSVCASAKPWSGLTQS